MMRKTLVGLGTGVAATAAALALVAPTASITGGRDVEDRMSASAESPSPGSILDSWGNRDLDISFGSAMARSVGGREDGWADRDIDVDAFGAAMALHFVPWAQAHDKFV
jgi:hypothetical protein